jgi:hypothetical protein
MNFEHLSPMAPSDENTGSAAVAQPEVVLTEDLLNKVVAAMKVALFDEKLFDVTAGGALAAKLEAIMDAVRAADVDELVRSQQSRFTLLGADVETRMKFAWARKRARSAIAEAEMAAIRTANLIRLLEEARETVEADVRRLAQVAAMGANLIGQLVPPDTREAAELRARLDRRLNSLTSLHAASMLTLGHIPQAITRNRQFLDRFNDVNTVLFPVWERHALAVLQSPRDAGVLADALAEATRALGLRLLAQVDGAARQ